MGTQGGKFEGVGRIAINNSGAGGVPAGTVYVADIRNNRVQRFTPSGGFERAWGFDVEAGGGAGFEICTVAANCKAGDAAVTTANGGQLDAPEGIAVNQTTGHVYVGESGNRRVSEFDADGNFIRAWGSDVLVGGVETFEICIVASDCKTASASGTDGGRFGGTIRSIVPDSAGNIWVADSSNLRFQKFDSAGSFIAANGFNVNNGGVLENCTSTAAGVCKAGTPGTGSGQFNGGIFSFGFDSAGDLYANNGGNLRIEKFIGPAYTTSAPFAALPELDNTGAMLVLPGDHFLVTLGIGGPEVERKLQELDDSGDPVQTDLAGIGLTEIRGLARNSAADTIYLTTPNSQANVLILKEASEPDPPVLTVNPVTVKDSDSATLTGSIDPKGSTISSCSFQYSTDQTNWTTQTVSDCPALIPAGGAQSVSVNVIGLIPNTKYFVRLVANRLFVPGTSVSQPPYQIFTTDSAAPTVSSVGAVEVADDSALLVGTIDPRGSGTVEYFFEYGSTPSLGSSTPPATLANGSFPVVVTLPVAGLSPGTVYYFRLVATNTTGSTPSDPATLTTRGEPLPPPTKRAYEMVSPADKNGGAALSGYNSVITAPDGEAVGYCTTSLFGKPTAPQSYFCADYLSRRAEAGWQTKPVLPSYCRTDLEATGPEENTFGFRREIADFSSNLESAAIRLPEGGSCSIPALDPAAPVPQANLYRESLLPGASGYDLLAPALGLARYAGSSDDFSHVVYTSSGQQTSDSPAGSSTKVFEWDEGALRLVSKSTIDTPFLSSSSVPSGEVNGISSSGDRIFFQNPSSSATEEVYMREGGSITYDVSQSECTSSCGSNSADQFLFATPDGSKVMFKSTAKLTNNDDSTSPTNADLFLYTHSAEPLSESNLTLLSKDNEPADGVNAGVLDVLGISDDAEVVYFVATGQVVAGKPTASGPKLYRWDRNGGSPTTTYLATLVNGDAEGNWTAGTGVVGENRLVTPDGKFVLIGTKVAIDPIADTDTDRDVYRWDEAGGWICASCQLPGAPSAGDALFFYRTADSGAGARGNERRISMSDDGERIFYGTPDALVPADVNGEGGCPSPITVFGLPPAPVCGDVYEWHDGTVQLLTSGTSTFPAPTIFLGASNDGEDVFVYTDQRLVGWDTDNVGDIYDVRIGGGFEEPQPPPQECADNEGCHDSGSSPPSSIPAGSAAFQGPGNQVAKQPRRPRRCGPGKRRVTKNGRTRCVKRHKKASNRQHNRGVGR